MRRLALPVGAAVAVIAAAFAIVLTHGATRTAYQNGKGIVTGVVVPGGESFCQRGELVPAGATTVTVWVSTAHRPGGPLRVRVYGPQGVATSGAARGGYVDSPVTIAVRRVRSDVTDATVCVYNTGRTRAAFMGAPSKRVSHANTVKGDITTPVIGGRAAQVTHGPPPVTARLDWHLPGRPSWLGLSPVLARRAALAKASFAGAWTFWTVLALALLAAAAAIAAAVRRARIESAA